MGNVKHLFRGCSRNIRKGVQGVSIRRVANGIVFLADAMTFGVLPFMPCFVFFLLFIGVLKGY